VHFIIPAPFMTDASKGYSDKVSYEIEQESADLLKVKLIADAAWIKRHFAPRQDHKPIRYKHTCYHAVSR